MAGAPRAKISRLAVRATVRLLGAEQRLDGRGLVALKVIAQTFKLAWGQTTQLFEELRKGYFFHHVISCVEILI
jgi:hypothetical protein